MSSDAVSTFPPDNQTPEEYAASVTVGQYLLDIQAESRRLLKNSENAAECAHQVASMVLDNIMQSEHLLAGYQQRADLKEAAFADDFLQSEEMVSIHGKREQQHVELGKCSG